MQVLDIMHKGVTTVQITDTLKKVASIMKSEDIGSVPVYKNERAVGFVTDRDIVITCLANGRESSDSISHAMTRDIHTIKEKDDVALAAKLMKENQISRLLVLNEGEQPVGMLSLHDISLFDESEKFKADLLTAIKH